MYCIRKLNRYFLMPSFLYLKMIAKGKDASDLFPAVVKNVVSKNIEVSYFSFIFILVFIFLKLRIKFPFQVKKLVYVYLVRYAEEQQDLALLSISTFQRALKVKRPLNEYFYSCTKQKYCFQQIVFLQLLYLNKITIHAYSFTFRLVS